MSAEYTVATDRETSSQNRASASGARSTVAATSIATTPFTPASDSSVEDIPRNSLALALINLVDVVTLSDI